MTSEAAKKAYPDESMVGVHVALRRAFDAGAVEALRRAAEKAEPETYFRVREFLERMADEWGAEQ